jgi:hypothetical protein
MMRPKRTASFLRTRLPASRWPATAPKPCAAKFIAAAALWSGQETDRTGGLTLIDSKELLNRWHQLRARYPDDFDLAARPALGGNQVAPR